jgi:hypothetical protein
LTKFREVLAPTTSESALDDPSVLAFGEFVITLAREEEHKNYIIAELQILRSNWPAPRIVTHLWYHEWKDNDAPKNIEPLVDFMHVFRSLRGTGESPVVVHCNAGIGRTGVTIAADIVLDQYFETHKCDVLQTLCMIREDRSSSIPLKVRLEKGLVAILKFTEMYSFLLSLHFPFPFAFLFVALTECHLISDRVLLTVFAGSVRDGASCCARVHQ